MIRSLPPRVTTTARGLTRSFPEWSEPSCVAGLPKQVGGDAVVPDAASASPTAATAVASTPARVRNPFPTGLWSANPGPFLTDHGRPGLGHTSSPSQPARLHDFRVAY